MTKFELLLAGRIQRLSSDLQTLGRVPVQVTIATNSPDRIKNLKELAGLPIGWQLMPALAAYNSERFACYIWCRDWEEPGFNLLVIPGGRLEAKYAYMFEESHA